MPDGVRILMVVHEGTWVADIFTITGEPSDFPKMQIMLRGKYAMEEVQTLLKEMLRHFETHPIINLYFTKNGSPIQYGTNHGERVARGEVKLAWATEGLD